MACSKKLASPDLGFGLAIANNKFAIDLYRVVSVPGENSFMSPFSITTVLSMANMGARGDTATQMSSALHVTNMADKVHYAFHDFLSEILSSPPGYKLSTANKLFVRQGKVVCKEFLEKARSLYQADAELCDFVENPSGACKNINRWVEKQTNNKIKNIVSPAQLSGSTAILLINAIYFKGSWKNKFLKGSTHKEMFSVSSSRQEKVEMMHQTDDFRYGHSDKLQCKILEMFYAGQHLSMVILLPDSADGLDHLERTITADDILNISSCTSEDEIIVSFPKFKMECSFDLSDALVTLGMTDAFDPNKADFQGIDPSGLLSVSKVLHKAFVEVNEEGTEAAAATSMDCCDGIMDEPKTFKADHPFLFFIRDNRCNMILFLGKICKPSY